VRLPHLAPNLGVHIIFWGVVLAATGATFRPRWRRRLIGLPSLVLGWLCARGAAQWLGTSALRSVNASAAKELSSMGQVGGDLESNMSVRTLDSLTVSIDTTAVLYVSLGLLAVMLVCVAISCIPMLRKSPRSLSELR
jgi:putative ABC transport system permease protein